MEVYLIRHGETDGNLAHRHQAKQTKLTDKGVEQAQDVAELVKEFKPTQLYTSNLIRAIDTARIIGDECNLVPMTSQRFVELVRPKNLYGHYHKSLRSIIFYILWYLGSKKANDSEGESYSDLRRRISEAKEFLASHEDSERIVVVSHTAFISMFVAHLCRDKALTPWVAATTFYKLITMPNTHLTSIVYNPSAKEGSCAWSVNK